MLLSDVSAVSGGSAFSTEQEAALAREDVDVVIYSLKDLPTANPPETSPDGPSASGGCTRCPVGATLAGLLKGARVGTGAPRRIAQLLAVRPDIEVVPFRGDVPPRLKKMETMWLDAVVLVVAGLRRLGLDDAIGEILSIDLFPPSPGQGALGIQVREDSTAIQEICQPWEIPRLMLRCGPSVHCLPSCTADAACPWGHMRKSAQTEASATPRGNPRYCCMSSAMRERSSRAVGAWTRSSAATASMRLISASGPTYLASR